MKSINFVFLCLIILAATYVEADESRIPLYAPSVTSTTIEIKTPGSYVLTRNFSSSADPVISIEANDVSIDLNGRTITNTGTGETILMTSNNNLSIKNGTLAGGTYGIRVDLSEPQLAVVKLSDLTVRNTGVGAFFDNVNLEMISCHFNQQDPALAGLQHAVSLYGTGRLIGNSITESKLSAVRLHGSGLVFRHNIVRGFNQTQSNSAGLYLQGYGSAITDNTIGEGGNGTGISVTASAPLNTIAHNSIYQVENGMRVDSSGNVISGNSVSWGGPAGMTMGIQFDSFNSSRNLIENNKIWRFAVGINFTTGAFDNAYRNNMLLGNVNTVSDPGSANIDAGGNI